MRAVLFALLLAAPPALADARAVNGMAVRPLADKAGSFAVLSRPRAGPADFWCAAGDYAERALDVPVTARVYLLRPHRRAPVFTVVAYPEVADGPRPGEDGLYGLSLSRVGFNLRAAHARSYCRDSVRRLLGLSFGPGGITFGPGFGGGFGVGLP